MNFVHILITLIVLLVSVTENNGYLASNRANLKNTTTTQPDGFKRCPSGLRSMDCFVSSKQTGSGYELSLLNCSKSMLIYRIYLG